jgi:YD repeat-containing protein
MSQKTEPVASNSVTYGYDLRGLQTSAVFTSSGLGVTNGYDGFGRRTSTSNSMISGNSKISRTYDLDGDLTWVIHPNGSQFQYTNDGDDRFTGILENGATSIVSQNYFPNGLPFAQSRGAVTTSYGYQNNTLLSSFDDKLAGIILSNRFTRRLLDHEATS